MSKQIFLLILLFISFSKFSTAQVLCIYCYDQNTRVSSPVNNLIANGGFEIGCSNQQYFCPASANFSCNLNSWTCTGGDLLTYARTVDNLISVIPEGILAAYFGNYFCNSCSITQYDTLCLNTVDCEVTGIPSGYPNNFHPFYGGNTGVSLATLPNTLLTPGNTYVLEFWAGGEWDNGTFTQEGLFAVDVGFGKIFLRDKVTAPSTGLGTRFIIVFNATTPSPTIKFTNWGHICDSCTELILDDVRLYTLAELSTSVPACNTGVSDASGLPGMISISPNPVVNELNIEISNNENSEIIVYDISLRKFLQKEFINSVSLNTEQLAKGIYLYEVRNKNGVIKQGKVVKD